MKSNVESAESLNSKKTTERLTPQNATSIRAKKPEIWTPESCLLFVLYDLTVHATNYVIIILMMLIIIIMQEW